MNHDTYQKERKHGVFTSENIIQGINAPFLAINGRIYFNEWLQDERKAIPGILIDYLSKGGDLMWFIEGTWNTSPNSFILPAYWSIVDVAKAANALIVPIAVDQYDIQLVNKVSIKTGNHFKINIGKPFDMQVYGSGVDEKKRAINDLSTVLSSLKFEIWKTEPIQKRSKLDENYWEKFLEKRFKEWPYFNKEYISDLTFKPKVTLENGERIIIAKPDGVFEPLKNLNNANASYNLNEFHEVLETKRKILLNNG